MAWSTMKAFDVPAWLVNRIRAVTPMDGASSMRESIASGIRSPKLTVRR
jgi:hypothetical protein